MNSRPIRLLALAAATSLAAPAFAAEDVVTGAPTSRNRIEFWDINGMPYANKDGEIAVGKVRRYIDVGRLTEGR